MSVIAAALKHMLAAGMPHDAIIAAVEAMESAMPTPAPIETAEEKAKRKARERQARYEEKKRQEASGSVRKTSEPSEMTSSDDLSPSLPPSPQTPQPPTHPPVEKTTRARATKRVPEAWTPSAKTMEVAAAEGFSPGQIERELATMRDHEFQSAKTDWDATFRNWLRRKQPAHPITQPNGLFDERPHHRPAQRTDRLDRMLAGAVEAADREP